MRECSRNKCFTGKHTLSGVSLLCVISCSSLTLGVGGNLVAIQASRISTYLHLWSVPGVLPYKMRQCWPNPCISFFSTGQELHLQKNQIITAAFALYPVCTMCVCLCVCQEWTLNPPVCCSSSSSRDTSSSSSPSKHYREAMIPSPHPSSAAILVLHWYRYTHTHTAAVFYTLIGQKVVIDTLYHQLWQLCRFIWMFWLWYFSIVTAHSHVNTVSTGGAVALHGRCNGEVHVEERSGPG